MTESSKDALAARLNQKIARQQRLARLGTHLVIPTIAAVFFVARWSEWLAGVGVALLVLEALAIARGKLRHCPFCDATLSHGRRGETEFFEVCPECGYMIE